MCADFLILCLFLWYIKTFLHILYCYTSCVTPAWCRNFEINCGLHSQFHQSTGESCYTYKQAEKKQWLQAADFLVIWKGSKSLHFKFTIVLVLSPERAKRKYFTGLTALDADIARSVLRTIHWCKGKWHHLLLCLR